MPRLTSDRGACTVATMPWLAAPLSSSLRVALVPCAACPRKPCAYPIYPCMPDREGLGGSNDPPSVGRRLPSTDVASCRPPCGPAELASLQELSGFRGAVTRGGVRARRGCTGQGRLWRVHPRRSETGGLPSEALQSGVPEATTSVQNALAPTPWRSVEKTIEPAALELLTLLEVPMHLPVS